MEETISSYSKSSKIPLRILRHLKDKGVLSSPLTHEDFAFLSRMEQIWCDRQLLRSQLGRFSLDRRLGIIETASLKTKWERYAFTTLRNLPPGNRIPMKKLVATIENYFRITLSDGHQKRLIKIYRMARNSRYRAKMTPGEA